MLVAATDSERRRPFTLVVNKPYAFQRDDIGIVALKFTKFLDRHHQCTGYRQMSCIGHIVAKP